MSQDAAGEVKIILAADAASYSEALDKMKRQVSQLEGHIGSAAAATRREFGEARGAIAVLGEEIGIHLPRHVRSFVAELPGVSKVMAHAFDSVAVIAIGVALFEAGKKVHEFMEKTEEASRKNAEAWRTIAEPIGNTNSQLQLSNDRMAEMIAKLEGRPNDGLKVVLDEAAEAARKLGDELKKDSDKMRELMEQGHVSFWARMFGNYAPTDEIAGKLTGFRGRIDELNASYGETEQHNKEQGDVAGYQDTRQRHLARLEAIYAEMDAYLTKELRNYQNASETDVSGPNRSRALNLLVGAYGVSQQEQRALGQGYLQETMKGQVAGLKSAAVLGGADADNGAITIDTSSSALAREYDQQILESTKNLEANNAMYKQWSDGFATWLAQMKALSLAGEWQAADMFKSKSPRAVLAPQHDPTVQGAIDALNQLTQTFTDARSVVHDTIINTFNEFNDTMVRAISGGHASFGDMARGMAGSATRSGLQLLEGAAFKAVGFGKRDGSSPTSAIYTIPVTGMPGTSLPGVSAGMDKVTGWLSSLLPHFAAGGEIPTNMPSIVGENGPEMFMPRTPGWIAPNSSLGKMGGNTWVIDARGTDPALTRANFERALTATYNNAVTSSAIAMADAQRRRPR